MGVRGTFCARPMLFYTWLFSFNICFINLYIFTSLFSIDIIKHSNHFLRSFKDQWEIIHFRVCEIVPLIRHCAPGLKAEILRELRRTAHQVPVLRFEWGGCNLTQFFFVTALFVFLIHRDMEQVSTLKSYKLSTLKFSNHITILYEKGIF